MIFYTYGVIMGVQKKISKKKIFFTFFGPKSPKGKKTKNFTFGILAFGTSKPTFNHSKSLEKPKKMHFASNVSHFWYQGQVFMVRKNMPKNAIFLPPKNSAAQEERGRHGPRRLAPPSGNRHYIITVSAASLLPHARQRVLKAPRVSPRASFCFF